MKKLMSLLTMGILVMICVTGCGKNHKTESKVMSQDDKECKEWVMNLLEDQLDYIDWKDYHYAGYVMTDKSTLDRISCRDLYNIHTIYYNDESDEVFRVIRHEDVTDYDYVEVWAWDKTSDDAVMISLHTDHKGN